jgi:hypothetical protein
MWQYRTFLEKESLPGPFAEKESKRRSTSAFGAQKS